MTADSPVKADDELRVAPSHPFPCPFIEIINKSLNRLENHNNAGHLDKVSRKDIRNNGKTDNADNPVTNRFYYGPFFLLSYSCHQINYMKLVIQ